MRRGEINSKLVGLLVLTCLGLILVALLVEAIKKANEAAGRAQTANSVKNVALCFQTYQEVEGHFPPACVKLERVGLAPWFMHVFPYIQSSPIMFWGEDAVEPSDAVMPVLLSPLDTSHGGHREGLSSIAANLRVLSTKGFDTPYDGDMPPLAEIEPGKIRAPEDFKRGTANTILLATKHAVCGEGGSRFYSPPNQKTGAYFGQNAARETANNSSPRATFQLAPNADECRCSPFMAQAFTIAGLQVATADASVRDLSPSISPEIWNRALQPNAGLELGDDWYE